MRSAHCFLGGAPPSLSSQGVLPPTSPYDRALGARVAAWGVPTPPPSPVCTLGDPAAWSECPPLSFGCKREARTGVWGVPPPPSPSPGYALREHAARSGAPLYPLSARGKRALLCGGSPPSFISWIRAGGSCGLVGCPPLSPGRAQEVCADGWGVPPPFPPER